MKRYIPVCFLVWGLTIEVGAVQFDRLQSNSITQIVAGILQQFHYRQIKINNPVSKQFLDNYLNDLDPNHMIFRQEDVDEFRDRFYTKLDNFSLSGQSSPGFEIYSRYLQRLKEAEAIAQQQLKVEHDFRIDENYQPDRKDKDWPEGQAEMEELWRKRIKAELLQDRISKYKLVEDGVEKIEPYDPTEYIERLSKRYFLLLKNREEFDTSDILDSYLSALAQAMDPHSDYLSPIEAENFDIRTVKLSLTGIGAELRVVDGITTIVRLIPGGPASRSKQLEPDDKIVAVAQESEDAVDVIELSINKVVEMIRGPIGSKVRLSVVPADAPQGSEPKEVVLVRDKIDIKDQRAQAQVIEHVNQEGETIKLASITLPGFYTDCSEDVRTLLTRLKQEDIKGLVLDLRHNGGGLLPEAVKLTGLFFREGPVVQVRSVGDRLQVLSDEDSSIAYEGPLVVLVNHLSASASEIVAAALQDYGRAVVVGGASTHGKGTVQTLDTVNRYLKPGLIEDAGKIKFTVSKFFRVQGDTTQMVGVTSDITLPSIYDHLDIGEASLPNALPATKTDPQKFVKVSMVDDSLEKLKARALERINSGQDFEYVRNDIKRLNEQKERKSISLNLENRLQERKLDEERQEKRDLERKERPKSPHTVYELNLDIIEANEPLKKLEKEASTTPSETDASGDPEDSKNETTEDDESTGLNYELEEALNVLRDFINLSKAHVASSGK